MNESGNYVRELRNRAGLTQAELAERAGISAAYVAKIEAGQKPSSDKIVSLAMVLGITESELRQKAGFVSSLPLNTDEAKTKRLSGMLDASLAFIDADTEFQSVVPFNSKTASYFEKISRLEMYQKATSRTLLKLEEMTGLINATYRGELPESSE